MRTAEKRRFSLGFPWETQDPFLFCVYHLDHYPKGNEYMGPDASLEGRNLGNDFIPKDGWRMYHGHTVPGFPAHPYRGFEMLWHEDIPIVRHKGVHIKARVLISCCSWEGPLTNR